jgi:ankyrin repeat protein
VVEPPILEAALAGDAARTRTLLQAEPESVGARGAYAKTALHVAAEHDRAEVAEALLAAGADLEARTSWGMTPLEWAATVGSAGVGGLLLAHGARPSLYAAAGLGRLDEVQAWPEAEAGAVSEAFQVACRNGHTEVARSLLDRGARIDHPGYFEAPGLHWAAINGHADTVSFLLERGADPAIRDAEFDADALGWAREGGHDDVEALLAR